MALSLVAPIAHAQPVGGGQGAELGAAELQEAVAAAGPVTRAEVIATAQRWVNPPVPYSQSTNPADYKDGYRRDCSGYVSMAWRLSSSFSTVTLPSVSHLIDKNELQAGDVLMNGGPGTGGDDGHVAIFEKWADSSRTSYWAYEQAPPQTTYRKITYPYGNDGRFKPYRYNNIVDDAPTNESASVVVEAGGAMQVFNRDRNTGYLATNWQRGPGLDWAGWHTPMNVPMTGTPAAVLDHKGQMITFSRRSDGHLIQMAQDGPDGEIKTWWDLGGDFAGDPVAIKQPDHNKVVFVRGTDGQLWHKWQNTPDGEFRPSELVHPNLGVVTGKPSVVVDENNLLTVFVVRADGHLIMASQPSKTQGWVQWDLGGDFAGDPSAVRTSDGKFVVFVRGTDGKLWVKWQNEKGGVFPASALVNTGFGQIAGAPAAVLNSGNVVQVFARRADGHLATAWQTTGGAYGGFDDIGGNLASDPAIGMLANGAKSVFARWADGSIMTTWQPNPGDAFNRNWSYLLTNS